MLVCLINSISWIFLHLGVLSLLWVKLSAMCFSRLLSCCRCPINSPMLVSDVRSNLKRFRCLATSLVRDWPIYHVYPTKKLGFISLSCTCVFLSWLVIVWLKLLLAVLYCSGKNKVQNVTIIFVLCPISSYLFLFFWLSLAVSWLILVWMLDRDWWENWIIACIH